MQSAESGPPAAVTSPPSRRTQVMAGFAGFLVGSGVLGTLWVLSGVTAAAADDARAACAALHRAGELPLVAEGSRQLGRPVLDSGLLRRLAAARELAAAAAEADAQYRELADHIDGVSRMVIGLNFADRAGHRHLQRATEICART